MVDMYDEPKVQETARVLLGLGYPVGPIYGDEEHLMSTVRTFCVNAATHGGSWGVRKCGARPPNSERGFQRRIGCTKAQTHQCTWSLCYEKTQEGWYAYSYAFPGEHSGHSHPLEEDSVATQAHYSGLYVPAELVDLAVDAAKGTTAAAVDSILRRKAKTLGLRPTWSVKFIYDRYVRDREGDEFDMSDLVENLMLRERNKGLRAFMRTVPDGLGQLVLDRVFIEMDHAMAEWSRGSNVLLFDPTAKANKYGMKLCPFVTVGPTGQTVILAAAVINVEDTAAILWTFECFHHHVFKVAPLSLVTDEGSSILAAFAAFAKNPGLGWHGVQHRI